MTASGSIPVELDRWVQAVFGLTPAAHAVYRVALLRGTWRRQELRTGAAVVTCLADEDVEAALTDLAALGLVRPSFEADGQGLRVPSPAVALDARLVQARGDLFARRQGLESVEHVLRGLQEDYDGAQLSGSQQAIEQLTGLDAVRSRLEQLARQARTEVLAFMPGGAHSAESLEASRPLDAAALGAGVILRNIYQHSALNDQATASYLRWLRERGAETRTVATLPMRMLVVDREVALIPVDAERPRAGALVVRSPGVLSALLALFESVWASARPASERRATAELDLTDTDREILRLLSAGATDDGLARQLGVSARTVRRLTSVLMTRFAARSRFELGLKLGRRSDLDGGA